MDNSKGLKQRGREGGRENGGEHGAGHRDENAASERSSKASGFIHHELDHVRLYDRNHQEGKKLSEFVEEINHFQEPRPKLAFCSVKTPWRRRLQTLAVAWHVASFVYILAFAILALANPIMWIIMFPYMAYYAFDRSPANGNVTKRYSKWMRGLTFWRYYCDYFPIQLHKTADLKPTFTHKKHSSGGPSEDKYLVSFQLRLWPLRYSLKVNILKLGGAPPREVTGPRYIFGYHPHGVAALGAFGAFATEGANWSKLFPGIPMCLMTLVNQFQIPFYRDYLLSLGVTTVSKKNALKVLERNHSICIVVGGAQEALMSKLGSADLVLKRRKGFIKLALETGNVCLVPCFAFGETDCYNILETDEKSYLHKFQLWFKKTYGFTIPLFFARGLFNYDFGLIPFRKPINVVTGNPIYIKRKHDNPTVEEIDHYQKLYIDELQRTFDDYKRQFGYKDLELNLAE
ncbi:Diacylglycerol O-acyltransferase [Lachancea thermotolerans]